MSQTTRYDVKYDADAETWRVEKAGASRATAVYPDKHDAIGRATELALAARPSRVVVHDRDGRIEESRYDDRGVAA
ncbi:MAG: DUF2188 domain-containing protein [Deltaproteobacteria bacterium]|nr:DUF2188 domain-containing protein [Deltaproteobacteria bacterium]